MRRLLAVVLLVLVGCSSATADTTSTVGAEAAAATTAVTTTTAVTATTEAGGECQPHPDGYLATGRGFVCPPDLPLAERNVAVGFLDGVYRTRLFAVPFEYTRHSVGRATGEESTFVNMDLVEADGLWEVSLVSFVDDPAQLRAEILDHECAADTMFVEAARLIGGIETDMIDFTVECDFVSSQAEVPGFRQGERLQHYALQVDGTDLIVVVVASPPAAFDDYLVEVAEPLIDSIVFLDQ